MMSVPAITSGLSGEASAIDGSVLTGRRFAKTPSARRSSSRPCSGRTGSDGSDHFGPPTAPSSTASLPRQASIVCAGSAEAEASIAAPPISASTNVN